MRVLKKVPFFQYPPLYCRVDGFTPEQHGWQIKSIAKELLLGRFYKIQILYELSCKL